MSKKPFKVNIANTKRLFEHTLWVQEAIQNEIAKTNQDAVVTNIFRREGLDHIYITKL